MQDISASVGRVPLNKGGNFTKIDSQLVTGFTEHQASKKISSLSILGSGREGLVRKKWYLGEVMVMRKCHKDGEYP